MSTAPIRTGRQIRLDFLDFFKSKSHTIVPSSSLMPDSPNLLFTNAGMNQFVPIFLGQTKCPYTPGRAADTQKCIRAGGKHNDLDDVGLDTYHHTFFEMLGNWSFGDYFKKEAIAWAWELVIEVWKFPPQRIYATIYQPDKSKNDPAERDEEAWSLWAEKFRSVGLDPDIHIVNGNKKDNFWMMGETGPCGPCTEVHVDLRPGPRETDLETQKSGRALVNGSDARCIEIWNNVFIQYNANPDGTFTPLPAQHVDTGMGFERVTSIIQGTKGLTDFQNAKISNYETDIFRPIFDALEKMSGKKYGSTLPGNTGSAGILPASSGSDETRRLEAGAPGAEQIALDIAFRVIADHIRTLSFAIADGIQPGNNDRNYVLRRILRRAVRYGRTLGFHQPFFYKLVDVLAETMGEVFPEIRTKQKIVQETIQREEEAFNKTLDEGIEVFNRVLSRRNQLRVETEKIYSLVEKLRKGFGLLASNQGALKDFIAANAADFSLLISCTTDLSHQDFAKFFGNEVFDLQGAARRLGRVSPTVSELAFEDDGPARSNFRDLLDQLDFTLGLIHFQIEQFPGRASFVLYDTYGFPLDLTELMARERGLIVDKKNFERLMGEQRARARSAQKKEVISLSQIETTAPTKFLGYEKSETQATVLEVVSLKGKAVVILDASVCYAEMCGQLGDEGVLSTKEDVYSTWSIVDTQKSGNTWLHILESREARKRSLENIALILGDQQRPEISDAELDRTPIVGSQLHVSVRKRRRIAIERHHTVTHLLHWALHEIVSPELSQKGSFVGPEKLTFDFNSAPLTPEQIIQVERLVNKRILKNESVSWTEVAHADVKNRKDVMQFFGDKYGDTVRVVQIGGSAHKLDGYSMELCGGTHTRATGEIGLFRIVSEAAVAAGVRRIEAVAGLSAYDLANQQLQLIRSIAGKINSPVGELEKKVEALLAHQKELEKSLKSAQQREAAGSAKDLVVKAETINGIPAIIANLGANDGDTLQAIADSLKSQFKGVVVLGGAAPQSGGAVTLIASVSADFTAKVQAGKIIQTIAPIVGGKGGGKPDNARGGGKDAGKLDEALAKVKTLLG
jgi:alanyl-tRNA synthetase